MSGLSVYAVDNTPEPTEVVEKASEEKIVEETADNKAAERPEKFEETEEKTFSATSSIKTKSTAAEAKGATSGIYTYSVSNGEATVTKCNTSASGSIEIPSTIDGYPVTSIGGYAFKGCTGLTSITIPDSVT
ncbi:MAG: leucine-rich repeat protein, partial [Clostridia bacterium]|nr:leucine-rich repeat protein [Clostridia bacterium]